MSAIDPKDLHEMAEGNLSNYVRDHIHAAADEIEALRKDAERYRWLRIKCGLVPSAFGIGQVAMTLAGSTDELDAKRLDAHIDAAMKGANARLSGPQQAEET